MQKALFRKANRKVSYGESLSRNIRETEFGLSEFEYDMLREELEKSGIQFDELQDSRGEPSIYWGQNDGPRVDGIIQKVGIASFEHHKENRSEKLN